MYNIFTYLIFANQHTPPNKKRGRKAGREMRNWKGFYACMAPSAGGLGARCRNEAGPDGFCASHPKAEPVSPPTTVLVKFGLSANLFNRAEQAGIPGRVRFMDETQARHALEATLTRRSFTAYRPEGDTGCSVFTRPGSKEGLPNVTSIPLLFTCSNTPAGNIQAARLRVSTHLEAQPDARQGGQLVMVFSNELQLGEKTPIQLPADLTEILFRRSTWECFVWDNPARKKAVLNLTGTDTLVEFHVVKEESKATIVQMLKPKIEAFAEMPASILAKSWVSRTSTVNFRARKDLSVAKPPYTELLWADGHWDAKTVNP